LPRIAKRQAHGKADTLIGYAMSVKNRALLVDVFGSPYEILEYFRARRLKPLEVGAHRQTKLICYPVAKEEPELAFSGRRSVTILRLLETIYVGDLKQAASILQRAPTLLAGRHDGAAVPLLAAAAAGIVPATRFLLAHGTKVDGTTQFEMTALHWAAARGHSAIVTLLLDAGASPDCLGWFLIRPEELALINGQAATARLIAKRARRKASSFSFEHVVARMGLTPK